MWIKVKCPRCEEECKNVDSSFKYNYSQTSDNIAVCPNCYFGFTVSICDNCKQVKEIDGHTKDGDMLCIDCKEQFEAEPGLAKRLDTSDGGEKPKGDEDV